MNTNKEFYEAVWDILVRVAGASSSDAARSSFVTNFCDPNHHVQEWRFGGFLGFGGKFWRYQRGNNECPYYVSCYSEDRTTKAQKIIDKTNLELRTLYEKMNPIPDV